MRRTFALALGVASVLSAAAAPTLVEIGSPVVTERAMSRSYFAAARTAYALPGASEYTNTVITGSASANSNDVPTGVTFAWSGAAEGTCILEVSDLADFRGEDTRRERVAGSSATLYNFRADTDYFWRVTDAAGDRSATGTFRTAAGIRQIRAGQMRNVRDIGGWTGIRQGLVFRGSAWTFDAGKGETGASEESVKAFRDTLGIRSEIDLRGNARTLPEGNVDVEQYGAKRLFLPVDASISSMFDGERKSYAGPLRALVDPANLPAYIHCAGGADRTGAVIFLVEAICGVSDADKSIDYETTTHAAIYGLRSRTNRTGASTFQYAAAIDRFMADYDGATLNEKVVNYARTTLGLTDDEIKAIRINLTPSKSAKLVVR